MSRHHKKKEVNFDIEFRPSQQATAHGGQMAVVGLAGEYGLWEKLKDYPALDPRTDKHKGFDVAVYVASFVFGFCSGAKSISDIERLDDDSALQELLGVKHFPDQSALGEWLRNIGEAGVRDLRLLVRDFTGWALRRAEPARVRHAGMLESFFDDTQIEVEGKCFEGAKINYDGNLALSWQTLWVGPFLADAIMGSPSDHKEPVSDFDLHHPPCKSLVANNAYYLLGALAYNILMALKVIYLPPEHQPKRVRTLLQHLLIIPVEIKRHARRMKAVFFAPAGWLAWWKGFLAELLPRCRQIGDLTPTG